MNKGVNILEIFPGITDPSLADVDIVDLKIFKSKKIATIKIGKSVDEVTLKKIQELFNNELKSLRVNIIFDEEELDVNSISEIILKSIKINPFSFKVEEEDESFKITFFEKIDDNELSILERTLNSHKLEFEIIIENIEKISEEFLETIKIEEKDYNETVINVNTQAKRTIKKEKPADEAGDLIYRRKPKKLPEIQKISEVMMDSGRVFLSGEIFKYEFREIRNRSLEILTIYFYDGSDSIFTKVFLDGEELEKFKNSIKEDMGIDIYGEMTYDTYAKAPYIKPSYFEIYEILPRPDKAIRKRIELHAHTNMSAQDGLNSPKDLINRALYWGHEAIAITDHSVVQGFPEAMATANGKEIKIIYGMEINLIDDTLPIIKRINNLKDNYDNFVVFDVETTGFSAKNDKIIEIGAVKIKNGEFVDSFNKFIDPERLLPEEITNLTGITNEMLAGQPKIEEIIVDFQDFIKDSILVAHNAPFDMGFLQNNFQNNNMEIPNPYIDTLELSRILYQNVRSHSLSNVAKRLGVSLENAHRAVDDARATAEVFMKLVEEAFEHKDFKETLDHIGRLKDIRHKSVGSPSHAVLLAKNLEGLKNLYKLVSLSHMDYFYYVPRVPKSELIKYREGLLVGSACQEGELYQGLIKNRPWDELKEIAEFYDYFEIQPSKNNMNLIPDYFSDMSELNSLNEKILSIGDELDKLVVATGDVHYIDSDYQKSREILLNTVRMNRDEHNVSLEFLNTNEMLEEFSYLGNRAEEVVIDNSNKISKMIEKIQPIPDGTYPPRIEGSDEMLTEMTYRKAREIYGDDLPVIIEERIKKELDSIISNGYSVLYIISQKLVKKSNEDGYQVGSRGSVGSSLVATLSGITEVNPLPPHYVCPNCKKTEFVDPKESKIVSGTDLPEAFCPRCNTKYNHCGEDIPFEVFLGFDGDKEPDIDLNFAGEYQATAHKYTEELFGKGKVFRAGTIGTIAEKTAYGYVLKYIEEKGVPLSKSEIERMAKSLIGVKRTTGQHAGGIMIVPDYKDIHDFSPVQYPANDKDSGIITTHYDYNAISENILKLDILGHDVPTMIKMIEKITDTDFMKAPLNDEKVLSIFNSNEALELDKAIFDQPVGTLGIPEFGTNFVQRMLLKTKPKTFAELVQISGLSHGTNVWTDNAEVLVDEGKARLKDVISTREDIMNDLISAGADKKFAFFTMEKVRKGKGLNSEEEEYISTLDLPPWYIDSLNKISYMFPKAHAVAYVTMSVRLAYYKVYYPAAFYATFLSTKLSNFDIETISQGHEAVKAKLDYLYENRNEISNKEKSDIPIYELALEIFARGLSFGDVDLYKSDADRFILIDGKIIPPFRTVPSLGESVALAIVEERDKGKFLSIEDLVARTKLSSTAIENLKSLGALEGMSDSNQLSFFG